MDLGKWSTFTGSRVRFIEFDYNGATIHLKIKDQRGFTTHPRNNMVTATWSCKRFSDKKFVVEYYAKGFTWYKLFMGIRRSLGYQFNVLARQVINRLNRRIDTNGDPYTLIPHRTITHRGKGDY